MLIYWSLLSLLLYETLVSWYEYAQADLLEEEKPTTWGSDIASGPVCLAESGELHPHAIEPAQTRESPASGLKLVSASNTQIKSSITNSVFYHRYMALGQLLSSPFVLISPGKFIQMSNDIFMLVFLSLCVSAYFTHFSLLSSPITLTLSR